MPRHWGAAVHWVPCLGRRPSAVLTTELANLGLAIERIDEEFPMTRVVSVL